MHRFSLPLLSLLVLTPACDTEASSQDSERATDEVRGLDRHVPRMVGMLCIKLDCSDEQETELVAIARSAAPDEEQRAQHEESLQRFADAFRADTLDTDAVAKIHEQRFADRESIRDAALSAHQLLSNDQRDELAELIENFGPPPMMARRMSGAGPAKMAEHVAGRLCEVARCEGRQREQTETALSEGAPRPSEDEVAAMKARVASLEVMSEVHAILTPKQRDALATTLEEDGPGGLIGTPGFHGRI